MAKENKATAKKEEIKKPVVKVEKKIEKVPVQKPVKDFDAYKIIKYPLSSEKSIRLMESENKLIFVVDKSATKSDVKKAIEQLFKVKVLQINTLFDPKGRKRAYVKLSPDNPAIDIATDMGLM